MRGTGARPCEVLKLRKSYFVPNNVNGQRDGFDVFFPERDELGQPISFKGHDEAAARHKSLPEQLDDGFPLSQIIADYLLFAPPTGPLFQKCQGNGQWNGISWRPDDITSKMRDALRATNPHWPPGKEKEFSGHGFRVTTTTAMANGGVGAAVIAKAVNHNAARVTQETYIRPSHNDIRAALAVTGTRPRR
jgi:integrase